MYRPRQLKTCTSREAYRWTGNSCYIDTVLWVLFRSHIPYIDSKFLFSRPSPARLHRIGSCGDGVNDLNERIFTEFQTLFRKIARFFRRGDGAKTCLELRRLYRRWHDDPRCPRMTTKTAFHSDEQNESQEFLQFILGLYGMNGLLSAGAVSRESIYYGVTTVPRSDTHWSFIYSRRDRTQSLVWNVPYAVLSYAPPSGRSLQDFLSRTDHVFNVPNTHKRCRYNAVKTVHDLIRFGDLLVISIERAHPAHETILHRRVSFPRYLTDGAGKRLRLFGIICHDGEIAGEGHYTAYADCAPDGWYFYDDLRLPVQKVGAWEDLESIRSIASTGVLFFYSHFP